MTDDLTEWNCRQFSVEDWKETPDIVVEVLTFLCSYSHAIARHFQETKENNITPSALQNTIAIGFKEVV